APQRRGRVLARRREAADAATDLRHGLGVAGGAGAVPLASRGGPQAGPPPARGRTGPLLVPRRVAGRRVLASEGPADLAHAQGGEARTRAEARQRGDPHANPRPKEVVGAGGAGESLREKIFKGGGGGADFHPQADELPRVHVHLSLAAAVLPRPATSIQ